MGAGPSLGRFLKSMDDEDLVKLVESAYNLEPQRIEKVFALAKESYYRETGQQPPREIVAMDAGTTLSISAALLQPPQSATASSAPPMLSEVLPPSTSTAASCSVMNSITTMPGMDVMTDASDDNPVLSGDRDPMNALWTFEGHHLCQLKAADKNPHNSKRHAVQQGLGGHLGKNSGDIDPTTGMMTVPQRELDAHGYPVMYGSCGRDKRYGRCSVCYYRGLRCNTDHYCACCQKPVCIRPRMYPGEEHQKICWNVLHMDKEIIKRVQKKKKRKIQAVTTTAATSLKSVETFSTIDGDPNHGDRPNDSLSQTAVDLHRTPSIPTVVADVSGAVDL